MIDMQCWRTDVGCSSCLLSLVLVSVAGLLKWFPRQVLLSCAVSPRGTEKSAALLCLVNQRIDRDHGYAKARQGSIFNCCQKGAASQHDHQDHQLTLQHMNLVRQPCPSSPQVRLPWA